MASRVLNIPAFMAQDPQPNTGPVTLSALRYLLRFLWAPQAGWGAGAWLVDLRSADGTPLAMGTQITLTDDFWRAQKSDARVPQGVLAVTRVSGSGDPGPLDLGTAVVFTYSD